AELLAEHRHQRAEHADQGEGAQAGARRGHPLALEPDQQADSGRDQEGLDLGGIERQALGHGGEPGAVPRTAKKGAFHDTPTPAGNTPKPPARDSIGPQAPRTTAAARRGTSAAPRRPEIERTT